MKTMTPLALLGTCCLLLGSASASAASDFRNDLNTPFEPLTNPFGAQNDQPLPESLTTSLQRFLMTCFDRPVNGSFEDDAHVRPECASLVKVKVTGEDKSGRPLLSPVVAINAGNIQLLAVSWDADDSDRGDAMALAVYLPNGTRIAVYKHLYLEGNTFDALAAAVGVARELPKVQDPSLDF